MVQSAAPSSGGSCSFYAAKLTFGLVWYDLCSIPSGHTADIDKNKNNCFAAFNFHAFASIMAAMELSLDDIIKSNPKYKKTAKPVKNML